MIAVTRMPKLTPEIAGKVVDACTAGAGDAASALSAALENAMQIAEVTPCDPIAAAELPQAWKAPGLAMSFQVEEAGFALLLPEATNLLPPWYTAPDTSGEAKLQTLAQELSILLLPEDLAIDQFRASAVGDMAQALSAGKLGDPAAGVKLSLTGDDGNGDFYLAWPLVEPAALLPPPKAADAPQAVNAQSTVQPAGPVLPSYSQSLLNVKVPVKVNLAEKKMAVHDIVRLGPGTIIQFDKSCEDMIDMETGGQKIAEGEAVKVGDKFGLRITEIRLPDERYRAVGS